MVQLPEDGIIRPLQSSDAEEAAQLILSHFANDPGYLFVWEGKQKDSLASMYASKLRLLIEEEDVVTLGAFRSDQLAGLIAYNPVGYCKSKELQEKQAVLKARNANTKGEMGTRHTKIHTFRRSLFPPPSADGQFWIMHLAFEDEAIGIRLLQEVPTSHEAEVQTVHDKNRAQWLEQQGFCIVGQGTFEDSGYKIDCIAMRRPAKESS